MVSRLPFARQVRFARLGVLARVGALAIASFLCVMPALARVTRIQIASRGPFVGGATFGSVGAYEVIKGTVFFTADPHDTRDAVIFDIGNAPVDSSGLVEFSADFYILKPLDMTKSNGDLLYDVNNRGGKVVLQVMNDVPTDANVNDPSVMYDVGNGFLMRQGYTVVWVGWEGDLVPGNNALTAQLPVAMQNGQPIVESMITEFFDTDATSLPLSGSGIIQSYPAISTNQTTAAAQLIMRPSDSFRPSAPDIPAGTVIPNSQWSFSDCTNPSTTNICFPAGFQTNMVYQLIYKAMNPKVMGLGYATTRDFVSWLRYATQDDFGTANPIAGLTAFLGFGASQSGRYLRDFVYQGFNEDEQGRPVFDALDIHVAGANKLPLNFRFANADLYSVQHRGRVVPSDNFPRTYGVRTDPVSGRSDGILKRPSTDPKILHTVTSTEYWQYRASLVDTDESGASDIPQPANVREYLFAGTHHLASVGDVSQLNNCQQLSNVTTNGPLLRALLVDMDQWVRQGTLPPPSAVPNISGGTLQHSDQASTGFPNIPGVNYNGLFNGSGEMNFGPRVSGNSGVVDNLDPTPLSTHQVLVPKVNSIGIDLGGVQQPAVAAAVATLTGWNLFDSTFTDGDLCELNGMTIPLQNTLAQRQSAGDPRPSLQELYGDHTGYVNAVTQAAQNLQSQRLLLAEDTTAIVQAASSSDVLVPAPPPILTSIAPDQTVTSGTQVTETATLSTVAPSGGATVTLSSSNPGVATPPASVLIPAGQQSATFTVNTGFVSSTTMVTISGSFGGATQTASITVTPSTQVATPTFSPIPGTYNAAQSVKILDATPGAVIYYTTDGSTPTTSSTQYTAPINVSTTTTIKAIATASGLTNSSVATAIYTIQPSSGLPNYGSGFTSSGLTFNGGAVISGTRLQLTDGGNSEARSAFFTTLVNVQSFTNDFTFQLSNPDADGITFTIQGNAPTALGAAGGGLGYFGMGKSVAVDFKLYDGMGEGPDSTGQFTNGQFVLSSALDMSSSGVDLHSGDIMSVHMTYDGTTLAWTITDTVTSQQFTASAVVDIPSVVGGGAAYVGFTGGTGGLTAIQEILTWTYVSSGGSSQVATPTFSPVAGTYSVAQSVRITDTTSGALIHYTTDGSTPTSSSTTYNGPISVSTTTTIKAIATATGLTNSSVATATYTIQPTGGSPNYGSGFTSTGLTLNGGAFINGTRLQLTDGGNDEARSTFFTTLVNVQSFTNDFTFQLTNPDADGITFTIQGNAPTALGGPGGGLGYFNMGKSVAIDFKLYDGMGEGPDSTGEFTNGQFVLSSALDMSSSGVDLHSGDIMSVHMNYNGTTLTWTITDTNTGQNFTGSAVVNIPAIVGGNTAYVGFTGGTGGLTAIQEILTWTYVPGGF